MALEKTIRVKPQGSAEKTEIVLMLVAQIQERAEDYLK